MPALEQLIVITAVKDGHHLFDGNLPDWHFGIAGDVVHLPHALKGRPDFDTHAVAFARPRIPSLALRGSVAPPLYGLQFAQAAASG